MNTRIVGALIATTLTSLAGYAFHAYRERQAREQRAFDKAALLRWDTDGSGNPHQQGGAQAASVTESAA